MHAWQVIANCLIGALLAASIYLLISLGGASLLSRYANDYGAFIGLASIPAIIAAINISDPNRWTALASVIAFPVLLLFVFVIVASNAFPGSNFVPASSVSLLAQMPITAAIIAAIRCPSGRRLLLASFVVVFLAGTLTIRTMVYHRLDTLLAETLSGGGCVFAISVGNEPIRSVGDIKLDWIIGPSSGPIYFVHDTYAHRWSYSRLGLDTRMGIPEKHEVPQGMRCR